MVKNVRLVLQIFFLSYTDLHERQLLLRVRRGEYPAPLNVRQGLDVEEVEGRGLRQQSVIQASVPTTLA